MDEHVPALLQDRNPCHITTQIFYCRDDLLFRDSALEDEPKELLQEPAQDFIGRAGFKKKRLYVQGQMP